MVTTTTTAPSNEVESNAVPKIPDLNLNQLKFTLMHGVTQEEKNKAKELLWQEINKHHMAPFYHFICKECQFPLDPTLVQSLESMNQLELAKLQAKLEDAEKTSGETEISEALVAKADYLAKIGEKEKAITAYNEAFEKTPGVGAKIDLVFSMIRIGFFYNDRHIIAQYLEKAKNLIEQGGDWDRRNRCKVYEAFFRISQRDFKSASTLFLETLATFTSTELMSHPDFVFYTVISCALTLSRTDMKKQIIDSPEVLEFVHLVPHLENYMKSLFECRYNVFFETLAHMETLLKSNVFLNPHFHYYVREMRVKAYAQLLESYRSLTLESMALAFGVSKEFMELDLYRFISNGRLNCVIDKVRGIVETNRPDNKNAQYQSLIKQGDVLLNRIQKLGRVINV